MSFLRTQNIKRDDKGNIISGSASIMNTIYDSSRQHKSKQVVVEKLGKVLWLGDSNRSGIFLNPQRGLFFYDSYTDKFMPVSADDPRLPHSVEVTPERHVVFGTIDMFLHFLKNLGYTALLKEIFPTKQDFQRVICHLAHKFLKDGSHIHVDDFIEKTILSYYTTSISTSTLGCDTRYFSMMGSEQIKIDFFKKLVTMQQTEHPGFGKSCLVVYTPLPNDIENSHSHILCCPGTGKSVAQILLVLVLDKDTGIPVWYNLIPGNSLDINTLEKIRNDVMEYLELEPVEYTLDAGYCSKSWIREFFLEVDEDSRVDKDLDFFSLENRTDTMVRGKILSDMIAMPIYLQSCMLINRAKKSMTSVIGALEESICLVNKYKNIRIDYPTKKVKELQDALGLSTGNNLGLAEYFKSMDLDISC